MLTLLRRYRFANAPTQNSGLLIAQPSNINYVALVTDT
jgi:hypothetical protein